MTCREIQDMLYEYAGIGELPADVKVHVEGCGQCRVVFEELAAAAAHLAREAGFYPTNAERGRLLAAIDEEIDAREAERSRTLVQWVQWVLPAAAAAALILGIAFTGGKLQSDLMNSADSLLSAAQRTDEVDRNDALYDDLDDPTFQVLLEDVTTRPAGEVGGPLLDDLTEDEYDYLAKNFDVGEIL